MVDSFGNMTQFSTLNTIRAFMVYADTKLQQHVERAATLMTSLPDELRPVFGLIDAYQYFGLIEGEQSPRTVEALRLLLMPELRPALRLWFQRYGSGENMNPNALEFRARLSTLAKERFG